VAGENANSKRVITTKEEILQISFNRGTKEHYFCIMTNGIPKTYSESEIDIVQREHQPVENAE